MGSAILPPALSRGAFGANPRYGFSDDRLRLGAQRSPRIDAAQESPPLRARAVPFGDLAPRCGIDFRRPCRVRPSRERNGEPPCLGQRIGRVEMGTFTGVSAYILGSSSDEVYDHRLRAPGPLVRALFFIAAGSGGFPRIRRTSVAESSASIPVACIMARPPTASETSRPPVPKAQEIPPPAASMAAMAS